ncbi:MAG TPA: choloylglycine hydrolase family protein [Steroidobacteraceae bacterium]|nr:choloylglycine hydrolase family protein [Steroidobacteraceae bacterium]
MFGQSLNRMIATGLVTFLAASAPAYACTGIRLKAADGGVVTGRTLEFGFLIPTDIVAIPRGQAFASKTTIGPGVAWASKYATVGSALQGTDYLIDGMNEKGLAVGLFYFPTFASYAQTTRDNQARSVAIIDFGTWLLTNFATLDEVRAAVRPDRVVIAPTLAPGFPPEPQPVHFVVYDKTGASIVIEPLDGKLKVYDNPLGVITNSPTFDWHMVNLRNYIALNPRNVPPVTINGTTIRQMGQGSGMLGLPGDFTPPSRFMRATVFSATAIPSKTAGDAVFQLFHILNNFDIPVGVAREEHDGVIHSDYTILTTARDPQSLKYYWKTYDDQTIRSADLNALDPNAKAILRVSTSGQQPVVDMTRAMK